jgi:hypothetical protein
MKMYLKKSITKFVLPLLLAMVTVAGNAQTQRNGYFLDRYAYRYQLNPALMNDWGFLSISPLAHWGLDVQTNFGMSDFLYPGTKDGKDVLFTFMDNNSVSEKELSKKLPHTLNLRFNFTTNILSFGFFAWGGYNVFGLDFTNNFRLEIPRDFFLIPKKNFGGNYDLTGLGVRDEAYLTLSLGHARKLDFIDDKLTAGATLKVLLGAGALKGGLVNSYLNLGTQEGKPGDVGYKLNYEARAAAAIKLNLPKNADGTVNTDDLMDALTSNISFNGLAGWGLGIDLGATYQLLPELLLSAAITDLAFIKWKDQIYLQADSAFEYTFNGIESIGGDNIWEKPNTDGLTDMRAEENSGSHTTALNANLRLGAEYWVHKYISFGLLSTTRFSGWGTMTELMVTANIKPKWFNFVLNTSISNWGPSWGFYLGWSPRYFVNFFMSIDWLPYKYAAKLDGIPVPVIPANNVSLSLNMGASIPLNRNPDRVPKVVDAQRSFEVQENNALQGGTAIEWQQSNNAKTSGQNAKPVTVKGVSDIDKAESKEIKRLNKPIVDDD